MATKQKLKRLTDEGRQRNGKDVSTRLSPMAYARHVELVDLSNTRPLRARNTGYTPRESLLPSPSSPSAAAVTSPHHHHQQRLSSNAVRRRPSSSSTASSSSSLTLPSSPHKPSMSSLPLSSPQSSPSLASNTHTVSPMPMSPSSLSSSSTSTTTTAVAQHPRHAMNKATAHLTQALSKTNIADTIVRATANNAKVTNNKNSSNHATGRPPYTSPSQQQSPRSGRSSATCCSERREDIFRGCLSASSVDVDELRRLVWAHGLPPTPTTSSSSWIRPLAWKLLTGYLPPDRSDWAASLAAARAQYWGLVHDATVDPSARPVDGDHPLSDSDSSQWREFFRDADVRALIARDAKRTHPDMNMGSDGDGGDNGIMMMMPMVRDALERLLFVYAKTHTTLGYRQGMNELAAPFLIVFFAEDYNHTYSHSNNNGGLRADASDVEADAYFCFEKVMSEMTTCYVKDSDSAGIERQLRELQALLRIKDPQLEARLDSLGIDTRFYGLRWLRLWLSREFRLSKCLALWDSFLTAELRLPWIRYVCIAMLISIRDLLLKADFTACMKLLLHYPECDVAHLLNIADELRTSNAVIVRTAKS